MAAEYTEENLTAVRAAKLELATGTRKVSFSMGDKSFTYAQADMEKLESLDRQILTEIQSATTRPPFFLIYTVTGL